MYLNDQKNYFSINTNIKTNAYLTYALVLLQSNSIYTDDLEKIS
ncbi:hypothetical protein J2772_004719 [Chryseobacterium jejuense]|nr:hypothetical protein [Chryseobacterium jejuense]